MKRCLLSLIVMLATVGFAHADEPRLVQVIGRGDIIDAQWSPSGTHILVQTSVGAWIYDSMLRDAGFIDAQLALYSPDGTSIAGVTGTDITIYAADDLTVLRTLATEADAVRALAWSPDSAYIAVSGTADDAGMNRIWRADGSNYWRLSGTPYRQLAWREDGTYLAALKEGTADVDLYSTERLISGDKPESARLIASNVAVLSDNSTFFMPDELRWCPSGELMAYISGRYLTWHNVSTGQSETLDIDPWFGNDRTNDERAQTLLTAIAPDCRHATTFLFGSGGVDQIYDLREQREVEANFTPGSWLSAAEWTADGQRAAFIHDTLFARDSESIHVVEYAHGEIVPLFSMDLRTNGFQRSVALHWSPSSNALLVVGGDHRLTLLDGAHGERLGLNKSHSLPGAVAAISDDGQTIAIADRTNEVQLFDSQGTHVKTISTGHTLPVTQLEWQPGGTWLATGSGGLFNESDHTVRFWHVYGEHPPVIVHLSNVNNQGNAVLDIAWTEDGMQAAVSDLTSDILLIDPDGPQFILGSYERDRTKQGLWFYSPVSFLRWSPDSTRLAGTYYDSGGIYPMLWLPQNNSFGSIATERRPDYTFTAHGIGDLAWRADGRWVALKWIKHSHDYGVEHQQPHIQIEGIDPAMRPLIGLPQGMASGGLSPDGTRAFGENGGGIGVLWDAETGDALQLWSIVAGGMLWSGDSSRFAITLRGEVAIYDHNGKRVGSIPSEGRPAGWSHDGSTLAIHDNGQIEIWAVE